MTEEDVIKYKEEYNKIIGVILEDLDSGEANDLGVVEYRKGNYNKAFGLYAASALTGSDVAIRNIAECYEKGNGVKRDVKKAVRLYTFAGLMGNSTAYYRLFMIVNDLWKDEKSALEYLKEGAKLEEKYNEQCCTMEYGFYLSNHGKHKEAYELYMRNYSPLKHQVAYNLGMCYYNGNGVEKNVQKAKKLFIESSLSGYEDAYYRLALIEFEEGNKDLSEMYLIKSISLGSLWAMLYKIETMILSKEKKEKIERFILGLNKRLIEIDTNCYTEEINCWLDLVKAYPDYTWNVGLNGKSIDEDYIEHLLKNVWKIPSDLADSSKNDKEVN